MTNLLQELSQVAAELTSVEEEIQELLARQSSLLDRKEQLQVLIAENVSTKKEKEAHTWEGTDFPWTESLDKKLKDIFKLESLRPMQRQTMNATLSKEDTLLIMPTGGGKSLCFQLPAVVDGGLTLIVSPLVSLMEDQQMALEQLKVRSAMLNAATSKEELKYVQDEMVSADLKLKLLYVTPEKLAKSKRFMNRLEKCYSIGNLARIVIDEVHCCSQWGHDFRPDYKFLGILKRQFPNTPILGLTATATTAVLEDVKKILNIPHAILFKASFNRPNLFYEVHQKPSSQKETIDVIHELICKRFCGKSGIVYCFSRKETEEVTSDLLSRGVKAGCYHADMDAQSRSRIHRLWLCGDLQVVVATVAFGMGIDKPDVRFVIHHSISKSMENLYQESGRAGRDDDRADCIVLYKLADVARQSSMVFTEQTGLQNLHGIVKYCIDKTKCRRSVLASHFGEVWDSSHCNSMCDNCQYMRQKGGSKSKEVTKYCQDVVVLLDAAAATEQRVTSAKLLDAWFGRGPSTLRVKSVAVPPIDRDTAERILAHMLVFGYIKEDFHFTAYSTICYIVSGGKARLLRNSVAKISMEFRSKFVSTPTKSLINMPSAEISLSPPSSSASVSALLSSPVSKNPRTAHNTSQGGRSFKSVQQNVCSESSKTVKEPKIVKLVKNEIKKNSKTSQGDEVVSKNGERNCENDPQGKEKLCSNSERQSTFQARHKPKTETSKDVSSSKGHLEFMKHNPITSKSSLKRQFVFSDDLDDEEDFLESKSCRKKKNPETSILISDDSDN